MKSYLSQIFYLIPLIFIKRKTPLNWFHDSQMRHDLPVKVSWVREPLSPFCGLCLQSTCPHALPAWVFSLLLLTTPFVLFIEMQEALRFFSSPSSFLPPTPTPLKSLEFHRNTPHVGISSPNFHPSSMLSTLSSWWVSRNSKLPMSKTKTHTPRTAESRRLEFPIHLAHLLLNIGICKWQDLYLLLSVVLKSVYNS